MTAPKAEKTFEQWQDDAFSSVLSLTLDNTNPKRSNRFYLKNVADELKEEGVPLLITTSTFDRVLVSRLEEANVVTNGISVLDYLLNSWRAANTVVTNLTGVKGKTLDPAIREARVFALKEAQGLLVSYMGISLQYPDMFPQFGRPGQRVVVDALLSDPNTEPQSAMPPELLKQIIARFASDGLPDIIAPIITELGFRTILRTNHSLLQPGFRTLLEVIDNLVSYPEIAQAIPEMATFDPEDCHGRRMQTGTALGPFLALSAFPSSDPAITGEYYLDAPDRSESDRRTLHSSLRTTVQFLQSALFQVVDRLIRAGVPARTSTLQLTLRTLATNALRSGMQVDKEKVVDDGFADNLAAIWLRLSEPFTRDADLKRIARVDPDWVCLRALRDAESLGLDDPQNHIGTYWRELTRVNADKEAIDAYLKRKVDEAQSSGTNNAPGFIADSFFTTANALHLGPLSTLNQYKELLKSIGRFKSELERIKRMPELLSPVQRMSLPQLVQRWETELKRMKREKIAMDAQILDPRRLTNMMVFYRFVMCFLLRQVDANRSFPQKPFALPEEKPTEELPESWCMLPEFLVEDPMEFIVFIAMYMPDILTDSTSQVGMNELRTFDHILPMFVITFLARPSFIRNRYLKAKLVDVLHMLTYRDPREDDDYVDTLGGNIPGNLYLHPSINQFQQVLDQSEMAKNYLVPALLRFYVDIEQTGASSQFYDKFNIRYYIARTLRSLWARGHTHVLATKRFFLQQYSADKSLTATTTTGNQSKDQQVIEEFVARLMTDTTYLLDESLSKLVKIHEIEKKQEERAAAAASGEQEGQGGETDESLQEQASVLQEAERMAGSYVSLAHETVHILAFLTRLVPRPFQASEVVDRLAAMLNYNLKLLAGSKCSNLRVKDMQTRFSFNPRVLLSELTSVYTHLGLPTGQHGTADQDASGDAVMAESSVEENQTAIDRFTRAVAEDDRSYSPALFQKAYDILERRSLKSEESLRRLQLFASRCQQAKVDSGANEFLDDEAPEQYLDPIMATLMAEPVRLPTSNKIMDLAVIKGQLLSDPRDPFNRAHLTVDMLEPVPELKDEINAWKEAKLRDYYDKKQPSE
ncbi:Ubiquitin conjugation factor E4 [Dipsacomyces acuminosporus]|nr:Ubiquitin conjugation factor E4 [Dipsacomyces acuminosporus]